MGGVVGRMVGGVMFEGEMDGEEGGGEGRW